MHRKNSGSPKSMTRRAAEGVIAPAKDDDGQLLGKKGRTASRVSRRRVTRGATIRGGRPAATQDRGTICRQTGFGRTYSTVAIITRAAGAWIGIHLVIVMYSFCRPGLLARFVDSALPSRHC